MNYQDQLKALHKQAQAQTAERRAAEAQAKQQAAQEAEVNFSELMKDVTPIKNTNQYVAPASKKAIKPRQQADDLGEENYFYVGEGVQLEIPATFSKNGQGANDIKRLQSGYYTVAADVDLHGYTQEEAQQVLNAFIAFVQKRGVCGEIIHGSGLGSAGYQPKLKTLVRRWLMLHPEVLAYAEPHKNNDGAVRILLKRRRGEDNDNGKNGGAY